MALVPGRAGGILLHPTSLPGAHGIGDLGPDALEWVDWLAGAGCRLWQILPLGPTGFANSPYQSLSSFAGNPLLLSLSRLQEHGLIDRDALQPLTSLPGDAVDYDSLIEHKDALLARAAVAARTGPAEERRAFEAFVAAEREWLEDTTLFLALLRSRKGRPWYEWPKELALRSPSALNEARRGLSAEIEVEAWKQFWFHRDWAAVRARAAEKGIAIIGDLPIYAAPNSADTWTRPELFRLDKSGRPKAVAGVPPDYYTPTGQLWGNPVYAWPRHVESGFDWWAKRVRAGLRMADILRIDHFRGLEAFWEVRAGQPTAEVGRWVQGPGAALLQALKETLGSLPLLAEDLGFMTPAVVELRKAFHLPGMKILQFGLEGGPASGDLPHLYERLSAAYTGTHDNDTALGWYEGAGETAKDFARRYLAVDDRGFVPAMVRAVWASVADWAIVPMQDVLGLGSEARMNRPGQAEGNWRWRMQREPWEKAPQDWLLELNRIYGRADVDEST